MRITDFAYLPTAIYHCSILKGIVYHNKTFFQF